MFLTDREGVCPPFLACCISSILFCLFLFLYHLSLSEDPEGQLSTEEEEARKIAEMGKPVLGEHSRLEVVIEESYEFKVSHLKTLESAIFYFVIFYFLFDYLFY